MIIFVGLGLALWLFVIKKRASRSSSTDEIADTRSERQRYYQDVYLRSRDWRIKRSLVLRRDAYRCRYCGERATEVHHLKYARQIGREPIQWLISVCRECHQKQH